MSSNPYEPPRAPLVATPESGASAPCPKCGQRAAHQLGFTWWGGVVGAKLLNHVECNGCSTRYNGKTGQSNMRAIIIYQLIGVVIVIAFILLLRAM